MVQHERKRSVKKKQKREDGKTKEESDDVVTRIGAGWVGSSGNVWHLPNLQLPTRNTTGYYRSSFAALVRTPTTMSTMMTSGAVAGAGAGAGAEKTGAGAEKTGPGAGAASGEAPEMHEQARPAASPLAAPSAVVGNWHTAWANTGRISTFPARRRSSGCRVGNSRGAVSPHSPPGPSWRSARA